jgi:adenylate cyclase
VPFYYDLMAFMEHVEPASLQIKTDEDGILRSQPMKTGSSSESFVARLYRAAGEKGDVPQLIRLNYALMDRIPLYSFEEITGGTFDLNRLRGKTVIIGMVSMNDDVHATPLGMRPGTQVHATALETLITGTSPLATGFWFDCGLVLVLCLAAYPFTRFRSPFRSLFWVGIFTVCIGAANFGVFARGYAVSLLPSLLAPVAMFCVSYLYRYMVEERGRRLLYRTFSYYVEPNVIDQLITRDPETLMKGEQHDVCILFLDIRGFTALSERIPADAVVAMLNAFFGQVTEVVQEHRGFVNKFIGDGMLAFFAVGPSYVDDALQASIDICRVTERLNASGELTPFIGDSRLAVGVGLHAGPVILGNIGSQRKLDFTVIGQTVNTASRIESLTKQYSRSVLVSKTVREMAAAHFSFDSLGVTPVKGIEGGVEIYSLSICIDPL